MLLVLSFVAALTYLVARLGRWPEATARRLRMAAYAAAGVVFFVILVRHGLHWVGAAGAAVFTVLRALLPLLLRKGQASADAADAPGHSVPGDSAPRGRGMDRAEALAVLDLREGATRDEILAAHRALIRKVHPDAPGGSTYLASKINQARDVLLG